MMILTCLHFVQICLGFHWDSKRYITDPRIISSAKYKFLVPNLGVFKEMVGKNIHIERSPPPPPPPPRSEIAEQFLLKSFKTIQPETYIWHGKFQPKLLKCVRRNLGNNKMNVKESSDHQAQRVVSFFYEAPVLSKESTTK